MERLEEVDSSEDDNISREDPHENSPLNLIAMRVASPNDMSSLDDILSQLEEMDEAEQRFRSGSEVG